MNLRFENLIDVLLYRQNFTASVLKFWTSRRLRSLYRKHSTDLRYFVSLD
ncbi:hypothetical protein NIES2104_26210 [Leptolyngbya sp. NIES-2104]|nr:hypothetical protein NIES2104_26210 [Leptolyngbya sp. NIES-2104]